MTPPLIKVREVFSRYPQINEIFKKGPAYFVDGLLMIVTVWGQNKPLNDEERAWLVEKGFNEENLRQIKKDLRKYFAGTKNFKVERKDYF